MMSDQILKVPVDRVGVLVGKEGIVKAEIEKSCGVNMEIDGRTGDVRVSYRSNHISETNPFKAVDIVTAIARGFSPIRAFKLLQEDQSLTLIDLREYSGKSENALTRIRSRLIGSDGKARKIIEELSETQISIYGHTVAIIGDVEKSKVAKEAIEKLASGGTHKATYQLLQKYRSKQKMDRMQLWESQRPPDDSES